MITKEYLFPTRLCTGTGQNIYMRRRERGDSVEEYCLDVKDILWCFLEIPLTNSSFVSFKIVLNFKCEIHLCQSQFKLDQVLDKKHIFMAL